ncbi:3-oxoacyl-[acyl-carrier-protein] synthase 2 [Planctomycetes bacterium Pan216]|uniref:3-oxoacyl-[acyl-carrier-protein] synthase 2 n=1 Tax=Kolteria novifilia TaxID=2527975 RepID=A0A518BCH7_9BACT|nr:3-oxoacyl-[acyl-carrier-protein] synthase 2 [Planctomycetes bacterium Pan216]
MVITGMAVLTALGSDLKSFWHSLCDGRSGIGPIDLFDTSDYKTRFGGQIKDFDSTPIIDARDQKRLDRFAKFAVVAAAHAVDDSGIDFGAENPSRAGVIIGTGVGGLWEIEDAHKKLARGPDRLSPIMIPRMMANSAPGELSKRYGIQGPTWAVSTACASASNAIGDAFRAIQRGDVDIMLTGGSEAAITPLSLGGFSAMRALSQRNDTPTEASRPFSRDRDGFVLSEGAGIVILEEYEHARARDAKIYAEILGFGSTSDAYHTVKPDPEGRGAANAMRTALFDAGVTPGHIDYVNAHGTSTPPGDLAETVALKSVYKERATDGLSISSTKSQLGHLLGASGGVETVVTVLSLYYGVLPPTINLNDPDPECNLDYVPHTAREIPARYAMSNSFGFGGHNATMVLCALDGIPRRYAQQAA